MRSRFLTGVTTGAILGAAVGMMMMPELDRSTKRKIKRSGRVMRSMAGDMYENMLNLMK